MDQVNSIYKGDCINLMREIKDKSIDLIISDPPYDLFSNLEWDNKIDLKSFWREAIRIIKDDAAIIIFASGIFKYELYNSNPKMFKYDMVWKKSKASNPFNAKYMPLRRHEYLLVFGNGKIKYNPQLIDGDPYYREFTNNKKNNMGYGVKGAAADNNGTRHPDMLLEFKQNWRAQEQLWPTQKPIDLLSWLIRSYSNKKDLVLDPMFGSGSTLVAALKEERNYLGFDSNEEAFEITKNRLFNFSKVGNDHF